MNATGTEGEMKALQHRAEQAIRSSRPREVIVRLLEEILAKADASSEPSRFAHRQLAEIHLEASPWAAALHLRSVLASAPDDDTAHALMGLCQAVQGNYRMAVASFRRAVALSPSNPWYNHNLGHLLDVALDAPSEALGYLRKAHSAQPGQEEVGASLAHCFGRLGRCDDGAALARSLLQRHPHHEDLRSLLSWLEQGAPPRKRSKLRAAPSRSPSLHAIASMPAVTKRGATHAEPDVAELTAQLRRAGATDVEIARAVQIWRDFGAAGRGRMCAVTAAAIDYALTRIDGGAARQREVADRHGVSPSELAARFRELRGALKLTARDARYS
jgi:tetratricopeptide (TPR) repeat protein